MSFHAYFAACQCFNCERMRVEARLVLGDEIAKPVCARDHRTPGTIEVPVSEVEALRDARPSLATNPYPADPIIARLPPKEPDHVERLRKIHAAIDAGFRSHEGLTREEHNARDKAALEAAIRAMESKS